MYQYCFSGAGRGNGRGAMPFLMSFALEPEIVTIAWIDKASVQFPLTIYATKGYTFAAMDFGRRLGASDEHIPNWICTDRATMPSPATSFDRMAVSLVSI